MNKYGVIFSAACRLFVASALLLCSAAAQAQTDSADYWKARYMEAVSDPGTSSVVITKARMAGVGAVNILDTYLSPEKYNGVALRYISNTSRWRTGSRWSTQFLYQGDVAYAHNRADNGNDMSGLINVSYGWFRNWQFLDGRLDVKAGGLIDANIGVLYSTRNGNNPVQVRAYLNLTPSAAATYHFPIGRHKYAVNYQLDVPMVGVMFSPNYGQSYYEIFSRGSYDHNIVLTTIGCAPSLRQILSLDIPVGGSTMRVGYMGDYQQADVNNLKSHTYTHMLVVGVVKTFSIKNVRR